MTTASTDFELTPKRIIIAIVALVILVVVGRAVVNLLFSSGETHTAQVRVSEMFEALKSQPPSDLAVTKWYGQRPPSSPDVFGPIYDEFVEFCAKGKLVPITSYEIREVKETSEKDRFGIPAVLVSGVANGAPFRFKVQRSHSIAWVD